MSVASTYARAAAFALAPAIAVAALAGPSPVSVPQGTDAVDLETEQFGVPDLGGDAPDEDSEGAEGADDEGDSPSR